MIFRRASTRREVRCLRWPPLRDAASGFTRWDAHGTRACALDSTHGRRTVLVLQIEVLPEVLMPKFLLPCADQGVRSRCVIPREQVVITDIKGDYFSVHSAIFEGLPPCRATLLNAADKVVEFQGPVRLSEV